MRGVSFISSTMTDRPFSRAETAVHTPGNTSANNNDVGVLGANDMLFAYGVGRRAPAGCRIDVALWRLHACHYWVVACSH